MLSKYTSEEIESFMDQIANAPMTYTLPITVNASQWNIPTKRDFDLPSGSLIRVIVKTGVDTMYLTIRDKENNVILFVFLELLPIVETFTFDFIKQSYQSWVMMTNSVNTPTGGAGSLPGVGPDPISIQTQGSNNDRSLIFTPHFPTYAMMGYKDHTTLPTLWKTDTDHNWPCGIDYLAVPAKICFALFLGGTFTASRIVKAVRNAGDTIPIFQVIVHYANLVKGILFTHETGSQWIVEYTIAGFYRKINVTCDSVTQFIQIDLNTEVIGVGTR